MMPRTVPRVNLDVAIAWETPDARPDGGARVGVAHTSARLVELGGRYFQLRLETPVEAAYGDRLPIRTDTGRGEAVVLDPAPPRHGPSRDLLARLAQLNRRR
jgi:selenocysteine-specific elongation factor